jgi:hypothetical protein
MAREVLKWWCKLPMCKRADESGKVDIKLMVLQITVLLVLQSFSRDFSVGLVAVDVSGGCCFGDSCC